MFQLLVRARRVVARTSTSAFIGRRLLTTKASARTSMSNFIGTTVGSALLVISGSIVTWPLADAYLGPKLAELAMWRSSEREREACALVLTSNERAEKEMSEAAGAKRPVVYVSLRQAATCNDLLFAVIDGIYGHAELGVAAYSMGVWWIVLFDMVMGTDPAVTRAFNFSIVLNHLRRACARCEQRPLLVLAHYDAACDFADAADDIEGITFRRMLRRLAAWCVAVSADLGLADVVIGIDAAELSRLTRSPSPSRWWGRRPAALVPIVPHNLLARIDSGNFLAGTRS